eukprot:7720625-Karenia_brevis.AAC.1
MHDLFDSYFDKSKTSHRHTHITLEMFENSKKDRAPKLKGSGMQIKIMLGAVLHAWDAMCDKAKPEHVDVGELLRKQHQIMHLLDQHDPEMFVPVHVSKKIVELTDDSLLLYSRLATSAIKRRLPLWPPKPKSHMTWHWARRTLYLNPRRSICLLDEDFVRRMKNMAQGNVYGLPLHKINNALLTQYRYCKEIINNL